MKLKTIIASALCYLAFVGCNDATEYTPSVYITEAQHENVKMSVVDGEGAEISFTVTSAQPVATDTHITLVAEPELVSEYNKNTGREAIALENFEFAKTDVIIPAGKNVSEPVNIVVEQELKEGTFYCIPVKIASVSTGMPVLEPSGKLFLVFRAPVKSKAVYIGRNNKCMVPTFSEKRTFGDIDLNAVPEVTLECRVYVNDFKKSDPYITSIMGYEGNLCMRFGDVKIGWDVLQVCKGDYQPAAINAPCATNKWYHVATVWSKNSMKVYIDGRLVAEQKNLGEPIDLAGWHHMNMRSRIGFGLGCASVYNGNRPLNGYLGEARVWTRALSGAEIANINDLVVVDPQSEGLLAYWKMSDCEVLSEPYYSEELQHRYANRIPDHTGHGYDAYGDGSNLEYLDTKW